MFFLFSQNQFISSAIADPCKIFEKIVIEEYEPIFPFEEKVDLGIFFNYEWDEINQKIIIKRNKNKFPVIKFSLFEEKLHPGAVVQIFNGEDLSKMDDADIRRLIENSESAKIQYFDENKINMIEVSSKKYDSLIFILKDFVLQSINEIEAKEGFFAIDHKTTFYYERTDLKKEGESLVKENCLISDAIMDKRLFYPEDKLTLINFETDQDKTTEEKYFSYYADSTWLHVILEGLAKIRVKFAFKKFPFDKQVLKIQYQTYQLTGEGGASTPSSSSDYDFISIKPTEQVFISLNNYMNDNYLQEWEVKSTKVSSEFVALDNFYFDQITLALEIERKSGYYLYKIIIPILLILAVAWYVLWIPTEDVASRLTTSIVAFLSLIAFNFVFQDDIPKLDILTSLDKFILLSYLFCAIPLFTTIRLSKAIEKSKKRASHLNKLIRSIGLVIYVFGSLTIFYPVL